jgi:hypothetical protein
VVPPFWYKGTRKEHQMSSGAYKPRLNVELRDDQLRDLQRLLDHGQRKLVFGVLVDDVISLLKSHRGDFLAAVIRRQIKYENILGLRLKDDTQGS